MASRSWIKLAAAASAVTIFAVAAALLPADSVNAPVLLALLLLAAAAASVVYMPGGGRARGVQGGLLLLGPTGVLSAGLLLGASLALYAGLSAHSALAWALNALTIGGAAVAWSLMQAGAEVVANVMQAGNAPSAHNRWNSELGALIPACTTTAAREQVTALAEQMRYAARDVAGVTLAQDAQITNLLTALPAALVPDGEHALPGLLRAISAALEQRELALKALRTQQ